MIIQQCPRTTNFFLQERNGKNTLSVANSLFANQNVRFAGQAKEIARNFYNVYIDALDFSNPQSTARTINDWVKKHTLNVIEEIVSPGNLIELLYM